MMLMMVACCRKRSRIAVAAGTSPINLAQSSSGRLLVIIVERFSWRRMMISSRHSPERRGNLLHSHVVDDEQVGLEITIQHFVLLAEFLIAEEVAGQVEDGAVQDQDSRL